MQWQTDKTWTLCLDRDGVINKRIPGGYITRPEDFYFLPGVLDAMPMLNRLFDKIFIITNQSGVGKGLMRETDLKDIHAAMYDAINKVGGTITDIYVCTMPPSIEPNCRKPSPAMGMQLLKDFPSVVWEKTIMVGDTQSDMLFGRSLNMKTVLIKGIYEEQVTIPKNLVDLYCNNLFALATNLLKQK